MLTKVIYDSTVEIYYTKFLALRQGTLVVPGPEIADLWRDELLKAHIELQTVTFADWIKSLSLEYAINDVEIVTKSELWDHFHRLWTNLGAAENFSLFQYVFEIYTELKSITADQEIFKQILEIETNLSQEVIAGLGKFYSLDIINDEYQVLRNLIDKIQHQSNLENDSSKKEVHLFGFKVLSLLQIELIQSLATHKNIYIYISSHLERKVTENNLNDWIGWIKPDDVKSLPKNARRQSNSYAICAESDFIAIWENVKGKKITVLSNSKELPLSNWGTAVF
jgi:hypothetical protein